MSLSDAKREKYSAPVHHTADAAACYRWAPNTTALPHSMIYSDLTYIYSTKILKTVQICCASMLNFGRSGSVCLHDFECDSLD